ncbi:YdcF family protein [Pannus brasiliensis CCIBt3594]|uniref:YdcF family protein n=1 Tax=Pannus brasiliensis CCIBt3594 TaxID=1427578 RepID=A0AAW9QYI4_9CHRO
MLTLLIGIIPVRIALAYHQAPRPLAILVLGGDSVRMNSAARLAKENPDLNVWISDFPKFYETDRAIFQEVGVEEKRIHYDFRATDTVTNFTTTVGIFTRAGIRHLYLVTSDYHMTRARAIATLVFGSRGVAITPVPVPSENHPAESIWRVSRDIIRSFLWILTGRSGASLNPRL